METILVFIVFVIGLIIIIKGGDLFVDSAVWIAKKTGIPSMIIGATIVSMATTLPEFFVSTIASNEGHSDIAVGNAVGSTICNIALILAFCTLIKPIDVKRKPFAIKGLIMILYQITFFIFASNGMVSFQEGLILIGMFLFYIFVNALEAKGKNNKLLGLKSKKVKSRKEIVINILKFVVGTLFIVIGAHMLVDSGVKIAHILRIPQQVISLTLIAIGTSLPELVTSLTAIIKGDRNISVGNILGANILNLSLVLGASAIRAEGGLAISRQTVFLDMPLSLLIGLIFVSIGFYKGKIDRKLSILLLAIYMMYMLILF